VNPEVARGGGIGDAVGLAGYTNGDVIRNPSLGQEPYLGRYFFRWTLATGNGTEEVEKGENQFEGDRLTHRLVLTGGKLGVNDIFDLNTYANSARTQFMNWDLINNPAYDYAADTRGYSQGVSVEWIQPTWAFRIGSFLMPRVANGIDLDPHFSDSRGDQAEIELHTRLIGKQAGVVSLLGYRNVAKMGNYDQAVASGNPPDIEATRQKGRVKYGFMLNAEQPLSDDGQTGLFARLGWNDGRTESFAYTECDDHISLGAQISGAKWKSPKDQLGIAFASNGLSGPHRNYLEAGGLGFLLGDGRLSYGRESVFESYYQRDLGRGFSAALDAQFILNPGYNSDRGPLAVLSARLHYEF